MTATSAGPAGTSHWRRLWCQRVCTWRPLTALSFGPKPFSARTAIQPTMLSTFLHGLIVVTCQPSTMLP